MLNVAKAANFMLECSEDDLGGPSRDHDQVFTTLEVGSASKIDDNNAACHDQF